MSANTRSTATPRRIGIAELEQRLATNRCTIWRWYSAGTFPAPHYIGRRRCWWKHDVEAWEQEQMSHQRPPPVVSFADRMAGAK